MAKVKPTPKPSPKPAPKAAPAPVARPTPSAIRMGPPAPAPKPPPPPPPPPVRKDAVVAKKVPSAIANTAPTQPAPTKTNAMEQATRNISNGLAKAGILTKPVLAYALATAQHETANTFQPIREYGGPEQAQKLGYSGGENYYGRGYIQLTHDYNYKDMGQKLGMGDALLKNPDLALRPDIASDIMAQFFKDRGVAERVNSGDFIGARNAINPDGLGPQIASKAMSYLSVLKNADLGGLVGNVAKTLEPAFAQPEQPADAGAVRPLAATPAPRSMLPKEPVQARNDMNMPSSQRQANPGGEATAPTSIAARQSGRQDMPTPTRMPAPATVAPPAQTIQQAQQSITPATITPSAVAGNTVSATGALGVPSSLATNDLLSSNLAYQNYLNGLFNQQATNTTTANPRVTEYTMTVPKIPALRTS